MVGGLGPGPPAPLKSGPGLIRNKILRPSETSCVISTDIVGEGRFRGKCLIDYGLK